jgi:hypothetical protein
LCGVIHGYQLEANINKQNKVEKYIHAIRKPHAGFTASARFFAVSSSDHGLALKYMIS